MRDDLLIRSKNTSGLKGIAGLSSAFSSPNSGVPNQLSKPKIISQQLPSSQRGMAQQKPLGSFKKGGSVKKTGIYKLHKGEEVLNKKKVMAKKMSK